MEYLLRFNVLALLESPKSTLLDIMPLFLNKSFQRRIIQQITDPYVKRFWTDEFEVMKYKGSIDGVAPIANKLGSFLAHPTIRKSLCEPEQPLRFRRIIDEGQILIVNLAKGRLGADTANVLGGLVLTSLAQAAYSRQDIPEYQRKPFLAGIDEHHSFTTKALADMLSELRKYKLAIAAVSQHSSQLDKDVFEAILGNAGSLISFRIGASDAPVLAKQFGSNVPSPEDLVGLANYEYYAKLMVNGVQTKPFSAKTLKPYQLIHNHENA